MIDIAVKGLKKLSAGLKQYERDASKALDTATKVEGYRLTTLLKSDIRSGSPGGVVMKPLSVIAARRKRSKKVLNRLALGVRYDVKRDPDLQFKFGWTGPKVSKSWKRLAEMHQEGFTRHITQKQRRYFRIVGGQIKGKRGRKARLASQVFFLRPETTQFKTPARPILDPFWKAHKAQAMRNIERNWRLKMAGKRI